jgi:hypothetical protein
MFLSQLCSEENLLSENADSRKDTRSVLVLTQHLNGKYCVSYLPSDGRRTTGWVEEGGGEGGGGEGEGGGDGEK